MIILPGLQPFFLFLCGHAFADFAIQSEWVATNKNRHVRDRYTPEERAKMEVVWPWLLWAHAFHHGLAVFLVSQRLSLAVAETVVHAVTDFCKTEKWFGFHTDQMIHIGFKVLWTALIVYGVV